MHAKDVQRKNAKATAAGGVTLKGCEVAIGKDAKLATLHMRHVRERRFAKQFAMW